MKRNEEELLAIQSRLDALEAEKAALLQRQQVLLNDKCTAPTAVAPPPVQMTSPQKIACFSQLFRGRDEVHAVRWENSQGRSGYAVACANEWRAGVCEKPKIKCGDCPQRAFLPLTPQLIHAHLTGKRTLGLYPLLQDDHCWLLAVDFDKSDWQRAVTAFRRACIDWEIPCAVERSRSGNGAHVWFFFEQPIPAKDRPPPGFCPAG